MKYQPITRRQILDWSKWKQSADDNFEFDENSKKFCKREENMVGKGEIARYEQFLLYPQCFQMAYFLISQGHQKVSLCGSGLIKLVKIFIKFFKYCYQCSLVYHELRVFLEGELLLGRALLIRRTLVVVYYEKGNPITISQLTLKILSLQISLFLTLEAYIKYK